MILLARQRGLRPCFAPGQVPKVLMRMSAVRGASDFVPPSDPAPHSPPSRAKSTAEAPASKTGDSRFES
jgi:hypothetical protein